jgi:hypothetical protein
VRRLVSKDGELQMAIYDEDDRIRTRETNTRAGFARANDSHTGMYVVLVVVLALVIGAVWMLKTSDDPNRSTAQDNIKITTQPRTAPVTTPGDSAPSTPKQP